MRLLHTSDWHLGRETYGVPRRPDHEAVIEEIVGLARNVKPNLIIHSGDLFDGPRPSYDDLSLGIDALQRLGDIAPVVVVCGNHDSPALFRLITQVAGPTSPVRFVDVARLPEDGGVIAVPGDRDEVIRLVTLPFIHANRLVNGFEDPSLRTVLYADRVAAIERRLATGLTTGFNGKTDILLFAAHLYVGGATYGRSERSLHVSEAYASRVEALPTVSYAALGHIHKPQALPGGASGRYAGSPIQLDFGEEGEDKTAVVVSAAPGKPAVIEARPLSAGRRLVRIAGTLEELAVRAGTAKGNLVHVTLRTEEQLVNAADEVAARLPGAVLLDVVEEVASRRLSLAEAPDAQERDVTMPELFEQYMASVGTRGPAAKSVIAAFRTLMEAAETDSDPHLAGEEAFADAGAGRP